MRHSASTRFWQLYRRLPVEVRKQADRSYEQLRADPGHPSLHLKRIGKVWSARVSHEYRAVGTSVPDGIVWVWVGVHKEYERLLRTQLREPEVPAYG